MSSAVETAGEISPFNVDVPEEELDDLRRRVPREDQPSCVTMLVNLERRSS